MQSISNDTTSKVQDASLLTEPTLLFGESNATSDWESESKSVSRISVVSDGGLGGR